MKTVWKLVTIVGFAAISFANAAEVDNADGAQHAKTLSGMSVLGNNEAPKALVIVP